MSEGFEVVGLAEGADNKEWLVVVLLRCRVVVLFHHFFFLDRPGLPPVIMQRGCEHDIAQIGEFFSSKRAVFLVNVV